jgi:hypothetical protein
MSVSVSKTSLFTSGEIKFSDLRASFKEVSSGSVSASELRRNTSTSNTNPIVPDATENAAVSSANNLRTSQFRNTIKYYDLDQSGTDLNLNIFSQTWNSNLSKNIIKRMNINGTCGSNSASTPSLYLSAVVYNLQLIVNGFVLGAGGPAGTSTSGGAGGSAMSLVSLGGAINVLTTAGAQVYGGGGGGAKGGTGGNGPAGVCSYISSYTTGTQCNGCPGCNPGYILLRCYRVGGCGRKNRSNVNRSDCRRTIYYGSVAPAGGVGGDGGAGQGYNQIRTDGSGGSAGALSSCAPNTIVAQTQGATGETGGNGGDWGNYGGGTGFVFPVHTNSGGLPGAAIAGSNYTIDSNSVTAAFRGPR